MKKCKTVRQKNFLSIPSWRQSANYRFDEPISSLLVCVVSPFQRKGETTNLREVLEVYVRIT